jgi:hypothetical protein
MRFFVNLEENNKYTNKPFWISSFTVEGNGLSEKIYSNRIEYFINNKYYSNQIDDKLDGLLKQINDAWIQMNICPKLLEFIDKKIEMGEKQLCLFDFEEIELAYEENCTFNEFIYVLNQEDCE